MGSFGLEAFLIRRYELVPSLMSANKTAVEMEVFW